MVESILSQTFNEHLNSLNPGICTLVKKKLTLPLLGVYLYAFMNLTLPAVDGDIHFQEIHLYKTTLPAVDIDTRYIIHLYQSEISITSICVINYCLVLFPNKHGHIVYTCFLMYFPCVMSLGSCLA